MHFMWQCGTLTFFLAIVAVTSGIMAFNGMQQHCMVQFINFNRLTISLRPIVNIWAFWSRRWGEVASSECPLPLSLRLWHNWVLTLLHRILPTSEHLRPVPSPLSISCPSSLNIFFCSDNVTICVCWSLTSLNWTGIFLDRHFKQNIFLFKKPLVCVGTPDKLCVTLRLKDKTVHSLEHSYHNKGKVNS